MRPIPHSFNPFCCVLLMVVLTSGCATSKKETLKAEDKEAVEALGVVASSYTNEEMSEEELQQVAEEIRTDEEARSAIRAIADSYEGKQPPIKYSPVTGKRYSGDLEYDPETGAKLVPLEP